MGFHATDLARLSPADREAFVNSLTPEEAEALLYHWHFYARPEQRLPPPRDPDPNKDWITWLILAGRGFGKTRVAAETIRQWIAQGFNYVNIIGATVDDVRGIMVDGESGIMAVCPRDERPRHNASKRRLEWPNGAISLLFSAEEPDRLRGKQHSKLACDELAAWRYEDTWDQAKFGLRLGNRPQIIVSTTPRPTKIIREIVADPRTHITRGKTSDNFANLADTFIRAITRKYEGTRLGRQELDAEILEDVPGALWTREMFDRDGFRLRKPPCDLLRVVVAVDPSGTKGKDDGGLDRDAGDEIGIVVAGLGVDQHGYVLYDGTVKESPENWARQAIRLFHRFEADHIVAEVNYGGDLVRAVIQSVDNKVPFKTVHATRGKVVRAEPVSTLYEQGRVFHIGAFAKLEDQLCGFTPAGYQLGGSPDRADALVWAITELMLETPPSMMDVL